MFREAVLPYLCMIYIFPMDLSSPQPVSSGTPTLSSEEYVLRLELDYASQSTLD